jgi:uncharacterized LabA/DUF88 family protein
MEQKESMPRNESNTNKFYNVALFIDYENICKTLIKQHTNVIRLGFFEKFRVWCKLHGRRSVKIAVYCNFDIKDLYESHHQSLLQSYGVETIHTSNQGKNYADLKITIDVLNSMYTNDNIDEFILMSNDKDMTPLLNILRLNKRKVSVITTGKEYNNALCEFADEQIKFEEIINIEYKEKDLLIADIENRFFTNIEEFVENGIKEYEASSDKNKYYKKNYNIEHFLESQSRYYQVMQYEILNMVKNYCNTGKAILYQNRVKTTIYTGILPVKYKDYFLENGIIKSQDILDSSKIDELLENKYSQYIPKESD